MDATRLRSSLKKGQPASTYLVCGEEDALVNQSVDAISDAILSGSASADFSLSRMDGKSASASEVENASRTVSLFGGRRLVIVKDVHQMRAEEQTRLAGYLAKPAPTATLVLVVRGAGPKTKDPKRAKATKAVRTLAKAVEKGGGQVIDCQRPKARDLPPMAEGLLREQGLDVDRDGLYALVDAVGEDLGALIQAVDKLALYKGGQGTVLREDVALVVADTRSQSVFALTDAAAEKDLKQALDVLSRTLRDGDTPLAILGHLVRHFRNLALVQSHLQRGASVDDIRAALGLHPFVARKSAQQSRRFSAEGLARRLRLLSAADRQLKSGRLADNLVLELVVGQLCSRVL